MKRKKDKLKGLLIFLNLTLIVFVGILLVALFKFTDIFDKFSQSKQSTANISVPHFQQVFHEFLQDLNSSHLQQPQAHKNLYDYISTPQNIQRVDASDLQKFITTSQIPDDYQYFFQQSLLKYIDSVKLTGVIFKDKHILLSIPYNADYKAHLLYNRQNLPAESLVQLWKTPSNGMGKFDQIIQKIKAIISQGDDSSPKRGIVVSGTYTSPFNMPTGLFVVNGEIINPALQKWDGILTIDQHNQIHLSHIDELYHRFRKFELRTSYYDYKTFLQIAQEENLSVMQSHLLVNQGKVLIKNDPQQKKFRRRILFQTSDNGIYIYDSLDEQKLNLFEAATIVSTTYHAIKALNLDIGSYNYCVMYSGDTEKNYSTYKKGVILSNLLMIEK